MSESMVPLSIPIIKQMKPKITFSKYKSPIVSLDFSADGTKIVTTAENNFISVYDVMEGKIAKIVNSNVYGAGHILWGAHSETVIVSSTLKDNNIRCLSLYDNKYIRVFSGHTDKVTDVTLSPARDFLLTCSEDKTFKLWDIRVSECTHQLEYENDPGFSSVDPEGLVVAIGLGSNSMRLYDFRNMAAGPFQTFRFENPPTRTWTKVKFSPFGNQILINTNTPTVFLHDAFTVEDKYTLNSNLIPGMSEVKGNFFSDYSNDEKYLFTGCPNGIVSVFDTSDGKKITDLKSKHHGHVTHTRFNPKYRVMATATDELHLWS